MQNENWKMGIGQNENTLNLIKHGTTNEYFPREIPPPLKSIIFVYS